MVFTCKTFFDPNPFPEIQPYLAFFLASAGGHLPPCLFSLGLASPCLNRAETFPLFLALGLFFSTGSLSIHCFLLRIDYSPPSRAVKFPDLGLFLNCCKEYSSHYIRC